MRRFVTGLSKKVLIANVFAELIKTISYSDEKTLVFCWMAQAAFFFQIYFDFSGYSDMAIGLGKMFGFNFPENFKYPYIARSVSDFWRRWHMTLTHWFRDYVYIPLGGNKVSKLKLIRNIAAVWLLTGFWHGASWNFVIWGVYFAAFLIAEKFIFGKYLKKVNGFTAHIYTLAIVFTGFVIFNANNATEVGKNLQAMFGGSGLRSFWGPETTYYLKSYSASPL